jgi:hypothetical protein
MMDDEGFVLIRYSVTMAVTPKVAARLDHVDDSDLRHKLLLASAEVDAGALVEREF